MASVAPKRPLFHTHSLLPITLSPGHDFLSLPSLPANTKTPPLPDSSFCQPANLAGESCRKHGRKKAPSFKEETFKKLCGLAKTWQKQGKKERVIFGAEHSLQGHNVLQF